MRSPSPDFRAGVTDMAPLLVGIAPFALIVGVGMVSSGLTVVQALSMSVLVDGGASQLAAVVARLTENLAATIAVGIAVVVVVVVQAI